MSGDSGINFLSLIPGSVAEDDLSRAMAPYFNKIHEGKIWKTYQLSDKLLLRVSTNRISIFDFVLPATVERKGEVLNDLTIFWAKKLSENGIKTHLVARDLQIDSYIRHQLQALCQANILPELYRRGSIVKKLKMLPFEGIVRGLLTGSGLISYQETGMVFDHKVPKDLHDGSMLPEPIFTPTTKANVGHDQPIPEEEVVEQYGPKARDICLQAYMIAKDYLFGRGIILADTKFELGQDEEGNLVIADEIITPDSSRFWSIREWQEAQFNGKSPAGRDKELVRQWGKSSTPPVNKLNPKDQKDLAIVHGMTVPKEILEATSKRYVGICRDIIKSK